MKTKFAKLNDIIEKAENLQKSVLITDIQLALNLIIELAQILQDNEKIN